MILKQRVVGSLVIIAILSIVLPAIVISKNEAFATKLISNIPAKSIFKISLPDDNDKPIASSSKSDLVPADVKQTQATQTTILQSSTTQARTEKKASDPLAVAAVRDKKNSNITIHIPLDDSEIDTKVVQLKHPASKDKLKSTANKPQADIRVTAPIGKIVLPNLAAIEKDTVKSFIPATETNPIKTPIKSKKENNQVVGDSLWVVQVGSFSKQSNANKLQTKLAKQGYNSYIELVKHNNATIFRVRIGPQKNQINAKMLQKKIQRQEKLDAIVMRYPN